MFVDGTDPKFRSTNIQNLLRPIAPLLPVATNMTIWTDDAGPSAMGYDQKKYLEGKIAAGEYVDLDSEELKWFEWDQRYKEKGVSGTVVSVLLDGN